MSGSSALADLGNFVRCTPSADMTLTLPAIATVPPGMGFLVKNDGTNNAVVYIDPNGVEQLDGTSQTFPLFVGEAVEFFSIGTSWCCGARPTGWRLVGRSSVLTSTSVDFVLPTWVSTERSRYRVEFRQVRLATDGASLMLRTSIDGGSSFAAGASDYSYGFGVPSGTATWAGGAFLASAITISSDADNTSTAATLFGSIDITPGAAGTRGPGALGLVYTQGNGASYPGPQPQIIGGIRNAAQDINAARFVASSGNISRGDFDLFACFD